MMDLGIKGQLFAVTGSTSGFGRAIATLLLSEGAQVIINARGAVELEAIASEYGASAEVVEGDITTDATISNLIRKVGDRKLSGIVINAGGPPAMRFLDADIEDWDNAYNAILRWKVKFTQELLDKLLPQKYGRLLYIESASVKQPIENLVLSNSLRLAVVGFVKTLSHEIAAEGITANVLAPGYHNTPAMERLFAKKSMLLGINPDEARLLFEKETSTGKLGEAADLASLAVWLLSPQSQYVTGQTISIDGGLVRATF